MIESKGTGSDSEIRTAAGQLADYCWNLVAPKFGRKEATETLRIVVAAEKPRETLVDALSEDGIAVFWRIGRQFSIRQNESRFPSIESAKDVEA
jgi:hypothetical protein